MHIESDRAFQMWAYSVSHSQLLIRSAKSKENPENIDVAFFGVTLMDVPSGFIGLTVEDASSDEVENVRGRVRDPAAVRRVYALISQGKRYLVAAADLRVSKNALGYRETDLDFLAFVKPGQRIVEEPPTA
jgi:hypothetical protein